jgi:hypothetical protein
LEYGYKEHGGIGADEIEESVKRRRDSISDGSSAFCTGRIGKVRIPFSIDVGIDDVIVPDPIKRSVT